MSYIDKISRSEIAKYIWLRVAVLYLAILFQACGPSHSNRVKVQISVPNVDNDFECMKEKELNNYWEIEMGKGDFDDGTAVCSGPIEGTLYLVEIPEQGFISVILNDDSKIGYKMHIEIEDMRDVEILRKNVSKIIEIVDQEIVKYVPSRLEMPEIVEDELRSILIKRITSEFNINSFFFVSLESACDLKI